MYLLLLNNMYRKKNSNVHMRFDLIFIAQLKNNLMRLDLSFLNCAIIISRNRSSVGNLTPPTHYPVVSKKSLYVPEADSLIN